MRRLAALLLVLGLAGALAPAAQAARPTPAGEITIVSTTPPTFTATFNNGVQLKGNHRDTVWVSMHCYPLDGSLYYYGEETFDANGEAVMDYTIWVLWSAGRTDGNCRAFLMFYDGGNGPGGEVVLDDTGWFTAP